MDKLIINIPGAPASVIELKPGVNRFGRSLNTDFQISHPSVSGAHCEIVATDSGCSVKDLGSTNGTLLDGKPIRESPWQHGQTLRLGDVEIGFASEDAAAPEPGPALTGAAPPPEPPAAAAFAAPAANVPLPPPVPGLPPSSAAPRPRAAVRPAVRAPLSYFAAIPGAFLFPFRRSGLVLLIGGTVFFVILNFLSGFASIISLVIGVFGGGYLFSFLKTVITTTAGGDDEMPDWPEYDGFMTSGLWPFLEMAAVFAVCLGPGCLYLAFAGPDQAWVAWILWMGGLVYMPMALLALAMYDNVLAMNPMLVLLSIVRVPMEYAAACLVLGLLALGSITASRWLPAHVAVPILAPVAAEFLYLYTLTVIMRVAGLLYYARKDRLHWKLSG